MAQVRLTSPITFAELRLRWIETHTNNRIASLVKTGAIKAYHKSEKYTPKPGDSFDVYEEYEKPLKRPRLEFEGDEEKSEVEFDLPYLVFHKEEIENYELKHLASAPLPPVVGEASETLEQQEKVRKAYSSGEITKAAAARLCDVSERTFHSWESGERTPPIKGFPGRSNFTTLLVWSNSLKEFRSLTKDARAKNRAISVAPDKIAKYAQRSAFDGDDD